MFLASLSRPWVSGINDIDKTTVEKYHQGHREHKRDKWKKNGLIETIKKTLSYCGGLGVGNHM